VQGAAGNPPGIRNAAIAFERPADTEALAVAGHQSDQQKRPRDAGVFVWPSEKQIIAGDWK
jgi:hypothetical protein